MQSNKEHEESQESVDTQSRTEESENTSQADDESGTYAADDGTLSEDYRYTWSSDLRSEFAGTMQDLSDGICSVAREEGINSHIVDKLHKKVDNFCLKKQSVIEDKAKEFEGKVDNLLGQDKKSVHRFVSNYEKSNNLDLGELKNSPEFMGVMRDLRNTKTRNVGNRNSSLQGANAFSARAEESKSDVESELSSVQKSFAEASRSREAPVSGVMVGQLIQITSLQRKLSKFH